MAAKTLLLALLAMASSLAMASDPSPLQDFCVADKDSKVLVNGFVCKDPKVRWQPKSSSSLLAMASSLAMASDPSPLQDFCVADKASKAPSNFIHPKAYRWLPKSFSLLLALASSHALASDPSPLQDFCVADMDSKVRVNGFVCKDPTVVKAEDFFSTGLDKAGDTGKKLGSNVTAVNVNKIVGLNTLGISMVRIDYAPKGLNAPHTHPRATEILTVIEGQLFVGFVTSNSDNGNRLFTKMLKKGDVFVFPEGLIHFQFNPGHTNTVAIGALSSQNPGTITIANAVFGSKPPISDEVLAKAFQITRMAAKTLLLALLAVASSLAMASDPSPLQDFCVADKASKVLVNGFVCKDPKVVKAEDFFFRGLDKAGDTGKKLGSNVTAVNVNKLAGLNTLGISMVRIDYAPRGLNPPHTHPRATEILTVIEGQLFVGFVTSNSDNGNRLFTKMLKKGDVFVFPQGLIHFQFNPGYTNTVAIGALSSQNPGTITVADAVFGSKPPISDEVLAKAFQVDKKTIDWLQAQF
ncbi:germin-like protein [Musa troglodytarum]|uniref:Germin-like protein n=1 Tax=Musa troglodytarum TaxID=320322 RepID=A0A9E7G6N2_9LILI|nr:germin-like protein [Musa troglodytarum]